ncbi:MAG: hypothetical protein SFV54_27920 [Bryobacteraceae bacterium]|nr:hypothetical protein [Bryobacteraceae bacterium]
MKKALLVLFFVMGTLSAPLFPPLPDCLPCPRDGGNLVSTVR